MRYRDLKRSRLSYDEWKCIKEKKIIGRNVKTDFFTGYIGIVDIGEVTEPQIWKFNGEDIVVSYKVYQFIEQQIQLARERKKELKESRKKHAA